MSDVLSSIRARRAEIARAVEERRAELEKLRAEDACLAKTEEEYVTEFRGGGVRGVAEDRAAFEAAPSNEVSQREAVLIALRRSDRAWLRSHEIAAAAKRYCGKTISERSLRPLLSVMKRDGEIARNGRLIALKQRAHESRSAGD